ncbi:MAG: GNAT family N-acetyltransferase [Planctomycetales bacterium]|nr:GNAT family N-acetyltransferase [Planctomycetales bacterium]
MITFRSFRNSDPPSIAQLWTNAEPVQGLMQPMSVAVLERHVFSRPYFDRHGMILAFEHERLVGFVHAGFGPNQNRSDLDMSVGVVCLVMTEQRDDHMEIRRALVERAEAYLQERGAKEIRAGCICTSSPFYLGLYGGSDMAGILESDKHNTALFEQMNYTAVRRTLLLSRSVANYRAPIDRRQLMVKRSYIVDVDFDVRSRSWWEACQFGQTDRIRFELRKRTGGPSLGEVTFWDMGMLDPARGGALALGLIDLEIVADVHRSGLGTFLVTDAFRQLQSTGVGQVLAQTAEGDEVANAFFAKLGFQTVDRGASLSKQPA